MLLSQREVTGAKLLLRAARFTNVAEAGLIADLEKMRYFEA
jgi:hypothetical protein